MNLDFDKELKVCEAKLNCKTFVVGDPPTQLEKNHEALRRLKRLSELISSTQLTKFKEIRELLNIKEN